MKEILLIWSFGTSDIFVDGKEIKNFRDKTEEISKNFNVYKDRITFPMLDKFLKDKTGGDIVYLKGIYTDQEDSHPSDTIFLNRIVENFYKTNPNVKFAKNPIILKEARLFVNIHDEISGEFSKISEDIFDKIYVCPTGGTKGIVSALFMASLEQLDMSDTSFFYGEEQSDGTTKFICQNGIKLTLQKRFISSALDNLDFDSVLCYINENELVDFCRKEYAYAKYMHSRLNADRKSCEKISEDESLPNWTRQSLVQLEEKINGIIYTWRKGRYVEFLGRIYNFVDSVASEKLNMLYEINDVTNDDVKNWAEKEPELEQFLDNYKVSNGQPLIWKDDREKYPNKTIKLAILEYKLGGKNDSLMKIFKNIDEIATYRNQTIIAHGNKPITKEIIEKKYGKDDLEEDFIKLLKEFTGKDKLRIDRHL